MNFGLLQHRYASRSQRNFNLHFPLQLSALCLFYFQHLLSEEERQLLLHLHTDHHSYSPNGPYGYQSHVFLQDPSYSQMFQSILTQVPSILREYLIGSTLVIWLFLAESAVTKRWSHRRTHDYVHSFGKGEISSQKTWMWLGGYFQRCLLKFETRNSTRKMIVGWNCTR